MEAALRADLTEWLAKWNVIRGLPPAQGLLAILDRVERELALLGQPSAAEGAAKSIRAYGEEPLSPS